MRRTRKVKILQLQKLEETESFLAHSDEDIQFKPEIQFIYQQSTCLEKIRSKFDNFPTSRQSMLVVLLLLLGYLVLVALDIFQLPQFLQALTQQQLQQRVGDFPSKQEGMEQRITQFKLQQNGMEQEQTKKTVGSLQQQLEYTHKSLQKYQSEAKSARDESLNWIEDGKPLPLHATSQDLQRNVQGKAKTSQPIKQPLEIQSNFWLFSIEQQKKNYYKKLVTENNKYFATLSNFTVNVVTMKTYQQFLQSESKQKVSNVMNVLRQRLQVDPKSNLKHHMETIEKLLAMFSILYDHGGIIVTESLTITENFEWVKHISQNIYVNRGNYNAKPQVVGFFSPYYSSPIEKHNKQVYTGMQRVDRYMIQSPTLQSYFVAARKNTQFIGRVIDEMLWVLMNHDMAKEQVINNGKQYTGLPGTDIYFETYLIAAKKVLIIKQQQLDSKYPQINDQHFAIDYYGIFTINCRYAPYKIKVFWKNSQGPKIIRNLVKYDIKEYYANVGDMRYMDFTTIPSEINSYLQQTKNENIKDIVMNGSYVQRMFFPNASQPFIYENKERPFVNTSAKPWDTLPKIIWVYWDTGIKNSRASTQLCVENLRRMGGLSGLQVRQVNDSNLASYLDDDILRRINQTLANVKVKIYPQSKGDMYRVALLVKYGGIYIDSSYFALENFDWLLNIGKYPTQYIFNRYGDLPKVVMYWHPHYGSPFDWVVDEQLHTKVQWQLSYENNFIAAQKGAEFVKQWLELYLSLLLKPYDQIAEIFKEYQTYEHMWISSNSQYLLAMDSAKCVIGRKQLEIQQSVGSNYKSASDYYKIWSMSGYLGQQKFRPNTNYDYPQSYNHTLLYRYPQQFSEGIVGKVRHLTKLYNLANKHLNAFIGQHLDGDFRELCHSQSIFIKYLFNKPYKLGLYKNQAILVD